jgi:hypothetical protein
MENTGYEPFQFLGFVCRSKGWLSVARHKSLGLSLAASKSVDLKRLSIVSDGLLFVAQCPVWVRS